MTKEQREAFDYYAHLVLVPWAYITCYWRKLARFAKADHKTALRRLWDKIRGRRVV